MFPRKPLHPTDLGLILSYKCQAACAHCLYNCGPGWQEWMATDEIRAALEATLVWDHHYQVHITGGEPFLNFPLLLHAVEITKELDIPCYVETNAGWCVRESTVEERFSALKNAGLQAVLISCSPFHAEAIPLEKTFLAIRKGEEIFGPRGVIVYLSEWIEQIRSFGVENTVPLEKYAEVFGRESAGRMFWQGYGLISGGRSAYRLGHFAPKHQPEIFKGQYCRQEVLYAHHSHFDLYGNYISWFCGGLTVGDWHRLPTLIEAFQVGEYPPLIKILVEKGAYGLFEKGKEEYGYVPLEQGYVGKCHLCVDVRRHLSRLADFEELQPTKFYEMV